MERIISYVLIGIALLITGGCAGSFANLSDKVEQERKQLMAQAERMWGKYEAGREIYLELRDTYKKARKQYREKIKDKVDKDTREKLEEMDQTLQRLDTKLSELNETMENFKTSVQEKNEKLKELEHRLDQADKIWNDILKITTNVSKIGVAVAT